MDVFRLAEKMANELSQETCDILSPLGNVAHKELIKYNELLETKSTPNKILILIFGEEEVQLLDFILSLHNWIVLNKESWLDDPFDPSNWERDEQELRRQEELKKNQYLKNFLQFCKDKNDGWF